MSLRYTALYLPAADSTTKETTASLAVAMATEATAGASDKSTTAALTVAPATEATAGASDKSTTAALTVTPTIASEGERVGGTVTQETTAALTVAPATEATGVREQSTTASLAVSVATEATVGGSEKSTTASVTIAPATEATATRDQPTDAALTIVPTTAAEAAGVKDTTATLTVTPTAAAEGEAYKSTANDGTAATDVSTTWVDESLAYDDDPLTYATASGVGVHTIDITGYDFGSVLGSGDELVSVTVNVSQYVSDGARFNAATVQAFDGATGIGSPIALLERTTAGSEDVTISGITLAQVRSAGFKVRYSVEQTS